tara:strand:- start:201 stop:734 length:534 start_codon:yes stop_codon:yes gene_type:complete
LLWDFLHARENGEVIMVNNEQVTETNEEKTETLDNVDNIKQLREEYKKLKSENKKYKVQAMDSALTSMGLSSQKGLGKAVTKLYDGDITVDAITDFVKTEFGEEVTSEAPEPAAPPTENVIEAQSRVEQLNKLGVDNEPADVMQQAVNYINDPSTSVKNSIGAKLAMMDQIKEQENK